MHYSTGNKSPSIAKAPQPISPRVDLLACHWCSAIDRPTLVPGSSPHTTSARFQHCGSFIKWLSQHTPAERQSRRQPARQPAIAQKPPNQLQLVYLQALGDDGPVPGSMAEASARIDALVRKEVA